MTRLSTISPGQEAPQAKQTDTSSLDPGQAALKTYRAATSRRITVRTQPRQVQGSTDTASGTLSGQVFVPKLSGLEQALLQFCEVRTTSASRVQALLSLRILARCWDQFPEK